MYLGIEIGGTKLQLAVGPGDGGAPVGFERRDINIAHGADGILAQIREAGTKLLQTHQVQRVGIGFGGPVDHRAGRVITSHQVAGWDDVPLASWCEENLGRPAVLGNDCDCAALAEARFGAGQGSQTVFFVTVGTGIGGGLVIGGTLHGQGRPAVAEIGHLRPGVSADSPAATVESYASGPGIVATVQAHLRQNGVDEGERAALLERCDGDLDRLTAKAIAESAAEGNVVARTALATALITLGWAIAQVIDITAAETVVVGGGVSLIGEEGFFQPLRAEVARYVFPPLAHAYQIVPAALGEAVVVHGALALAQASDSVIPSGEPSGIRPFLPLNPLDSKERQLMSNAPTAEQIQSFIQTYAPVLYLHPREHYLPTSVEWFLEKAGNPQGDGKDAYYEKLSSNERKGDFTQARSYVHVKDPVGDHVEIQFWIFYAYNGPGKARFPIIEYDLNLAPFGEHGGDWEHFTFRVDLATMKPTKVFLAQHGDGKLHDYGELEQEKGRPVLYASRNGHATYHDIGDHETNMVLLNATGKGSAFDTLTHSLLDVSPPGWLDFTGRWGPKITYSGAELDAKISEVHDRLSWFMKKLVSESTIKLAVTKSDENQENGPTGPKQKGEWSSPETD